MRLVSLVKAVAVDIEPLRKYRDFRLRTFAQAISAVGGEVTLIAILIQVKQLTGSPIAVGLIAGAELVPIIVCGLLGGGLADRFDRRTVALWSEVLAAGAVALLLTNALTPHPRLWPIYLIAAVVAGALSIQRPSIEAMTPRYVGHADLAAASAVEEAVLVASSIVGPSVGGVLATVSIPLAYSLDLVSYGLSLLLLSKLSPLPPTGEIVPGLRSGLTSIAEGLRYAAGRKDLLGTYVVDTIAMTMAMPAAVFPFFAVTLHAEHAVGLLYAAQSVGAFIATLTSGWITRIHRHGLAILLAAAVWGTGICLAGLAPSLPWALAALALAGGADMVSGLFRGTMWNQTIPDELRGRMAGIELLSYSVGPTVGNTRAGLMAARGVRFSIVGGGLLCVAGVSLAGAMLPAFRRYDSRTDSHALAERARRVGQ